MIESNDTRIVLGSLRYKSAPDTDSILNASLEQSKRQYIQYDRNLNVDLAQVFDDERQRSTTFRPAAKITFLMENSYTGITDYIPYEYNLYYINEESYATIQNANPGLNIFWGGFPQYSEFDLIRSDNNIIGYTSFPSQHVDFVSKSSTTYNWGFYLSYAFKNDENKVLKYNFPALRSWVAKNGIPFEIVNLVSNGSNLISFKCPVKHGMSAGEYVEVLRPNGTPFLYNGDYVYQIYSLGDGVFGNEDYYVNIYNYGFLSTYGPGITGTIRRIIDINNSGETKSKYYVREHKILTTIDDQILTNAGFDWNVFNTNRKFENRVYTPNNVSRVATKEGNQSYNLTFAKDIDISKLKDNLNRPITELHITASHRGYFGWFYEDYLNRLPLNPNTTSLVKEGWEFNLPTYDLNILGNIYNVPSNWWRLDRLESYSNVPLSSSYSKTQLGQTYTFFYNLPLNTGDTLYGDFCEWNDYDQKERVISDYYHKIYYNSRNFNILPPLSPYPEPVNPYGFYFKVHHPIILRDYSDYIEEGEKEKVSEIPDYAYYSQYRRNFRWRDIYTYGFIDNVGNGVDYPFLNGIHHPFKYLVFRLIPEGTNLPNPYQLIQDPTQDDCE